MLLHDTNLATTLHPQTISDTTTFKVYGSSFKVDSRYELVTPLGKGSYGIVCAAIDRQTGQSVAIKKVSSMSKRTIDAKHTLREVLLLQFLGKHPNIVAIHNLSANMKDDELYIAMDLMDTDMHRVLQSTQALSDAHVKYFLHQLLRGVKYLHDNGVLHRDLKPGNLLLSKTCQLKIADFGLARKIPEQNAKNVTKRPVSAPSTSTRHVQKTESAPMTEHVVTRWYRAPELMLQPDGYYDKAIDMWAVGCILAEILGRKAIFPGKNFLHQLTLIFDIIGTPSSEEIIRIKSTQAQRFLKSLGRRPKTSFSALYPNASAEAIDLLEKLLEFDPKKRLSASEALVHPYLASLERKYRQAPDILPIHHVDFSFDHQNLTKLDLRAMIVKRVDEFRTLASSGSSTEPISSDEDSPENKFSKSELLQLKRPQSANIHRMVGRTTTTAKKSITSASNGKVLCGSAGISLSRSNRLGNNAVPRQDVPKRQINDPIRSSHIDAKTGKTSHKNTLEPPYRIESETTKGYGSLRHSIHMKMRLPIPIKQASDLLKSLEDNVKGIEENISNQVRSSSSIEEKDEDQMKGPEESCSKVTSRGLNTMELTPCTTAPVRTSFVLPQKYPTPIFTAPNPEQQPLLEARKVQPSIQEEDHSDIKPTSLKNPLDNAANDVAIQKSGIDKYSPDEATNNRTPLQRAKSAGPNRLQSTTTVGVLSAIRLKHQQNNTAYTQNNQFARNPLASQETKQPAKLEFKPQSFQSKFQIPKDERKEEEESFIPKRISSKRLTIPKSPKFSVMSWQKKKQTEREKQKSKHG